MKPDVVLKTRIERELRASAGGGVGDVVVTVVKGLVTLSGSVSERRLAQEAERIATRASGHRPNTEFLMVRRRAARPDADAALVRRAITMIKKSLPYSGDRIRVAARDGVLAIEGQLEWPYQKWRVEQAARSVCGISGPASAVRLRRKVSVEEVKQRIQQGG